MNQVIEAILNRRSIRAYRSDAVADADRDLIVKAGLYAPSSKNTQAWHIAVVQNAAALRALTDEVKAAILRCGVEKYYAQANNPEYHISYGAPMSMIVSTDPSGTPCPAEDGALVLGNIFLAAHSLGIGSCWINQIGPVDGDAGVRKILSGFGVPSGHRVIGAAALGYAAAREHPRAPARKGNPVTFAG